MNIFFHLAIGASIVAISSNFRVKPYSNLTGFALVVLSHGVLDYIPHCYPIHSKLDGILGLIIIIAFLIKSNKKWKFHVGCILLGCVFPDLIDLMPAILNNLFNFNLPVFDHIFPWHFHAYSGSIYSDECDVSSVNHLFILVFTLLSISFNYKSFTKVF